MHAQAQALGPQLHFNVGSAKMLRGECHKYLTSELRPPQYLTGQLHLGSPPAENVAYALRCLIYRPADAFDTCCSKMMIGRRCQMCCGMCSSTCHLFGDVSQRLHHILQRFQWIQISKQSYQASLSLSRNCCHEIRSTF